MSLLLAVYIHRQTGGVSLAGLSGSLVFVFFVLAFLLDAPGASPSRQLSFLFACLSV